MQNTSETEKETMMATSYTSVPQLRSLADDPEIRRTRKNLLIILGILIGFYVGPLLAAIFGSGVQIESGKPQRGPQIGEALVSILLYGFGNFAVYRYSALGLRIFFWLSIIEVFCRSILLRFVITTITIAFAVMNHAKDEEDKFALTVAILYFLSATSLGIAVLILDMFIIKLARLIDANKNLIIQQS